MKKKYSKNEIIANVKGIFNKNEIMFIYYGGSETYKTVDENSDTDVIVVIKDMEGIIQMSFDELDIFAYGINHYKKRLEMNKEIPLYNRIFVDDYIYARNNLIYLDNNFKSEVNEILNTDIKLIIPNFIDAVVEYYTDNLLNQNESVKRNYHLYRIHEVIKRYVETGKYSLELSDLTKQKMMNFKTNWKDNLENDIETFKVIISDLRSYKEKLKGGNANVWS